MSVGVGQWKLTPGFRWQVKPQEAGSRSGSRRSCPACRVMLPPLASTAHFAMASPRPLPPASREREASILKNLSKTLCLRSSGIVSPLSSTADVHVVSERETAMRWRSSARRGSVLDGVLHDIGQPALQDHAIRTHPQTGVTFDLNVLSLFLGEEAKQGQQPPGQGPMG